MTDRVAKSKAQTVVMKAVKEPEPTAAPAADAALVQLHPSGVNLGRRYPLDAAVIHVGREGDVGLLLEVASVSRRQARMFRIQDTWYVEDLGSTNGTFVNERRVTTQALQSNDLVRFGEVILKFLYGSDIEAAYHEAIYRVSIQDGLTGVHNKRYFLEFLTREIARTVRYGSPLGLVMFDIDHFKRINDTHGHLAGDTVLKQLCARLEPRMRQTDLLARYGGEEFAVVLPSTPREGAAAAAEALRRLVVSAPMQHEDTSIPVTISLGVACLEGSSASAVGRTPERSEGSAAHVDAATELIRVADEKLYAAKHGGRNRVVW